METPKGDKTGQRKLKEKLIGTDLVAEKDWLVRQLEQ